MGLKYKSGICSYTLGTFIILHQLQISRTGLLLFIISTINICLCAYQKPHTHFQHITWYFSSVKWKVKYFTQPFLWGYYSQRHSAHKRVISFTSYTASRWFPMSCEASVAIWLLAWSDTRTILMVSHSMTVLQVKTTREQYIYPLHLC